MTGIAHGDAVGVENRFGFLRFRIVTGKFGRNSNEGVAHDVLAAAGVDQVALREITHPVGIGGNVDVGRRTGFDLPGQRARTGDRHDDLVAGLFVEGTGTTFQPRPSCSPPQKQAFARWPAPSAAAQAGQRRLLRFAKSLQAGIQFHTGELRASLTRIEASGCANAERRS